jgi:hypothetical protein
MNQTMKLNSNDILFGKIIEQQVEKNNSITHDCICIHQVRCVYRIWKSKSIVSLHDILAFGQVSFKGNKNN